MGAAAHYLEPATATDILQRLEAELSATIPQTAKQYEHTHIYQHPSTSQDTLEAGCYSRLSSCHPQTILLLLLTIPTHISYHPKHNS